MFDNCEPIALRAMCNILSEDFFVDEEWKARYEVEEQAN